MPRNLPIVHLYTDGACRGNPGPGGWAYILIATNNRREMSGGFQLTTNNRMEIIAVIKGLEALKKQCQVIVFSDSRLVVNALTEGWMNKWYKEQWKTKLKGKTRLNADLWKQLHSLCQQHVVTAQWVKGHNGNTENENCDRFAGEAMRQPDLPPDTGYLLRDYV